MTKIVQMGQKGQKNKTMCSGSPFSLCVFQLTWRNYFFFCIDILAGKKSSPITVSLKLASPGCNVAEKVTKNQNCIYPAQHVHPTGKTCHRDLFLSLCYIRSFFFSEKEIHACPEGCQGHGGRRQGCENKLHVGGGISFIWTVSHLTPGVCL